jgi:hypothetical protein
MVYLSGIKFTGEPVPVTPPANKSKRDLDWWGTRKKTWPIVISGCPFLLLHYSRCRSRTGSLVLCLSALTLLHGPVLCMLFPQHQGLYWPLSLLVICAQSMCQKKFIYKLCAVFLADIGDVIVYEEVYILAHTSTYKYKCTQICVCIFSIRTITHENI